MMRLGALALAALFAADDREDFLNAVRMTSGAPSYTFRIDTRVDNTTFGNAPREIPPMEGKFEKDVGLYLKVGNRAEIFRNDQKTYAKPAGQESWSEVGAYPFEGAAGDTPPEGRPQGGGPGSRDRLQRFGRMMVRNLKAPHEEVLTFDKGLKEVKKAELTEKIGELECAIYAGDFTDESLKDSPWARMFGRFGGAEPGLTGRLRAWVDLKGGALLRYEISTSLSMEFQGNAIDVSMVRTIALSDSGKTRIEIPEGLRKLLGEKSEDPAKKNQEKPDF